MPVVKRYPNRKLYDTQTNRYVTLEEIAATIQAGEDVEVLDSETGADLTEITLTQVIVALARRRATSLSRSVLSHLIRVGGSSSENWLRQMYEGIDRLQTEGELSVAGAEELRSMLGRSPARTAGLSRRLERQVESRLRGMSLPTQSDMERLRSQLKELAQQLEKLEHPNTENKHSV